MALIKCPDCGREFSDRIDACPICACPIQEAIKERDVQQNKEQNKEIFNCQNKEDSRDIIDELPTGIFKYQKKDLLSKNEAEEFAFNSIIGTINNELNGSINHIEKLDYESYGADYLVITNDQKIAIRVIVSVAPCKGDYTRNEELLEILNIKGVKFAIARIGIGSSDKLRFNRRIALKNDSYYFLYEGLEYCEAKSIMNIKYSLSKCSLSDKYRFIYEDVKPSNKSMVFINNKDYSSEFCQENYRKELKQIIDTYCIIVDDEDKFSWTISTVASLTGYKISLENVVLNFLNILDYCNGILFSDSDPVSPENIISSVAEFLHHNSLIDLPEHYVYNFAFYIFYYLVIAKDSNQRLSVSDVCRLKVKIFEEHPELFGFYDLKEKLDEKKKWNSKENFEKLEDVRSNFENNLLQQYISLNKSINEVGVSTPINFEIVKSSFEQLLNSTEDIFSFLNSGFDVLTIEQCDNCDRYIPFRKMITEFMKLLKLDVAMTDGLLSKSRGGKYNYFEYKKDSKKRNDQLQIVLNLISKCGMDV